MKPIRVRTVFDLRNLEPFPVFGLVDPLTDENIFLLQLFEVKALKRSTRAIACMEVGPVSHARRGILAQNIDDNLFRITIRIGYG